MFIAYDCSKFIFSDRKDKTAWLGETEDRKIGFFNSENVQEQFNYDSLNGKYNKICLYTYIFFERCCIERKTKNNPPLSLL